MNLLTGRANLRDGGAERQWSMLLPALLERGFDARLLTRGLALYDAVTATVS
jgi:hypothetical protein